MKHLIARLCGIVFASGCLLSGGATLQNRFSSSPAQAEKPVKNTISGKEAALLDSLNSVLASFESRECDPSHGVSNLSEKAFSGDSVKTYYARVPRGRPLEWIAWAVSQGVIGSGFTLLDCVLDEKRRVCFFTFSSNDQHARRIALSLTRSDKYMKGAAEIALIGEVTADTTYPTIVALLSIPEPIAISIISGKQQSSLIGRLAQRYRKEVIIRLPLEPASKIPSDFTCPIIMVHYPKDQIHSILSQAMKEVPNYSGFSNLWGGRAMEDSRIMTIVFSEIKKNHGYFLEIPTTKNSVAPSLAETNDIPFAEISGAITGKLRQAEVEKQLHAYAAAARNSGSAIVSINVDAPAVAAIKSSLQWFRQNGVMPVFPSQIVKKSID